MEMLEFFQRVLPKEGPYCGFTISADKSSKRNRFYEVMEDCVSSMTESDSQGYNTYFAVSSFKEATRRTKTNACRTKVIFLDVDCGAGKPYPTWKEGLKAALEFITGMRMPKPMIVGSGNGLHIYWVLDKDIAPEEWIPLAEALKKAVVDKGFNVDESPIANLAQVLRPIGTHNYKDPTSPKAIKLLVDAKDTTYEDLRKPLSRYFAPAIVRSARGKSALLDNLSVRQDFPPAVAADIASKCQQIRWAVENQDKVPEPFWYTLIGVAAFCDTAEDTAVKWSKDHPKYSESETLNKLAQWRASADGPSTCSRFESQRPGGCKGCPFFGEIGSPARLGVRYTPIDTSAAAPKQAAANVPVPKPFKRTRIGAKAGIVMTVDTVDVNVSDFDIYPLNYGYDESLGYEVARFMWDRPHVGWSNLSLRQAYLADGTYREFVTAIADQGIVLATKKQTEYFQIMLRAYMNELRKLKTVTNNHTSMGWKDDYNLFVLGGDIYRRDAQGAVSTEAASFPSATARANKDMFGTGGSFANWFKGTTAIHKAGMHAHQLSIGLGLASVLIGFTGLKGVTVSFYGPSGGGKSLAQLMQQSVWGDPSKLHFQSKFTHNALFGRFATYGNLPLTVDEATQMSDRNIGDFLYEVTQGRDKARLTRAAQERESREWALISTLSTNRPVAGKLIAGKSETDAQLARLLELKVDVSPMLSGATSLGRGFYNLFTGNYGWAGRMFLQKIMAIGEQGIRAMIESSMERFPVTYKKKFSGTERYWEVAFVLADLSMRLAHEWKIIAYPPKASIKWALEQVEGIREAVAENRVDMFDMVAEYLNDVAAETVRIFHIPDKRPEPDYPRLPRGSIRARIDVYRDKGETEFNRGVLLLDKAHFRKWLSDRGGSPNEFMPQLKANRADATPRGGKASLGKYTPTPLPQTYVIGIRLTHPRMAEILDNASKASSEMALGKLINVAVDPAIAG